jgi:hypothetical protein
MMVDLTTDAGRSDHDHLALALLATETQSLSIDLTSRMIQQLADHCARWSISPLILVDPIVTIPHLRR